MYSVYASPISTDPHSHSFSRPTFDGWNLCSCTHPLLLHFPSLSTVSREVTRYSSSTSCAAWPLPPALAERWVATCRLALTTAQVRPSCHSAALNTPAVVCSGGETWAMVCESCYTHSEERLQNCHMTKCGFGLLENQLTWLPHLKSILEPPAGHRAHSESYLTLNCEDTVRLLNAKHQIHYIDPGHR